jgi:polyisoprenoid-binding protein YceI
MRLSGTKSLRLAGLSVVGIAVFLSAAAAPPRIPQAAATATSEVVLTVDPAQSKVHWNVDSTLHMVHGTFNLKSGVVHFSPETGKAGGEIVVLATSGESGNGSRDARMHNEILETAKYPDAVFRPTSVEGKVQQTGVSDVKLHGTFTLHGADHDMDAPVHAEIMGEHWKGTSKFEVPYVKWGIKDPSNFMLKVKPVVYVELQMSGDVKDAAK